MFPGDLIRGTERTDFIDDEFRFDLIIRHTDDMDWFAAFLRTPKVFSTAAGVVFDEAIRGREDRIRAAVILLETDDLGIGEVVFKLQDVRHLGAAPSVDALIVIAHHANIRRRARSQHAHEIELEAVGILELIDEHLGVAGSPLVADIGVFIQKLNGLHKEVVKIHRVQG